jgi:uncharacterized protein
MEDQKPKRLFRNISIISRVFFKDGKLTLVGRFSEGLIGLAMIEVKSREEALNIMRNNPAIKAGVFHGELYPWRITLRSE